MIVSTILAFAYPEPQLQSASQSPPESGTPSPARKAILLVYYHLSDTIKELSEAEKYIITIPTRDTESTSAARLAKLKGVGLLEADYESEEGLRKAFAGQDACYFNISSFTVGEPYEYFLTFRAYEIAVQSKLKWFVLSGGPDRLKQYGYK